MFSAHVAEVVIASPDDTERFRTAIGHTLNWWNNASAQRHRIVLLPSDKKPRADDAQHGDVFIAVFDPTRRDAVEVMTGVERAKRAGKLAFAWLIAESRTDGLSVDDKAWLGDVTQRLEATGVSPRYIGRGDAHFESRLQTAITADLTYANLSTLTREFDSAAAAREVTIHRTPVALLGPQFWAVTVVNHGASLAVGLRVSVDAVDSEGNGLTEGARRSSQAISDVIPKLKVGPWPDHRRPLSDPPGALRSRRPTFLMSRMDIVAAHNAPDFPRWLRPNQHASALYSLEPEASPRVRIQFEDEAGNLWSRTNNSEPERISPSTPRHGELRHAVVVGE